MDKQATEEIKSWLKIILKSENVTDFSVAHLGYIDKGAGYLSDIVFVTINAIVNDSTKNYHLVLKSSKKDEILRETSLMKEAFDSEIYMYDTVLPAFKDFLLKKSIDEPVVNVPKFYGEVITANLEVLALENLKENGYRMHDKKKPLTRIHIDLITSEYAKFHAISAAMNDQDSKRYKNLVSRVKPALKRLMETSDMDVFFGTKIDMACELLKNEIDEEVLLKWGTLRHQIGSILSRMYDREAGFKVFVHGDCWNNNFMFKHEDTHPLKCAILDLQMTSNSSPILDLSYFLFATISETDIEDLDDILDNYYKIFSSYLERLGSKVDAVYPREQFLNDWKTHCKYGLIIVPTIFYMCSTEEDEVVESPSDDFAGTFAYDIKDPTVFLYRMKYVMEYVAKHNLI